MTSLVASNDGSSAAAASKSFAVNAALLLSRTNGGASRPPSATPTPSPPPSPSPRASRIADCAAVHHVDSAARPDGALGANCSRR